MTPKKRYAFWIDPEHLELLEAVKDRDGVLPSEQIRRALEAWFEQKGVRKAPRKRASTRKRG